ncbi:hypothetical protein Rhe02_19750 [Rhizocola hellebori]|uniref:Uncharacterized protein n=1 Tax=Rhizocola hellebori TaxID=1392758 RepID=A0A8J3Q607_9ACTN|nr:hypothetical protein [Rhizocola hellebori]GIH03908.1 hypothetical protein Rhe02_19750 [Rhizocola hellebori]
MLDRLHDSEAGLTAGLLEVSVAQCRTRMALDWDNAWRLDAGEPDRFDHEVIDVSVRFCIAYPGPAGAADRRRLAALAGRGQH